MKQIIIIICLQSFVFSAYPRISNDSICFRLVEFEKIRGRDLVHNPQTAQVCNNFNIIELSRDSNQIVCLYKFENIFSEASEPGFILIENNIIEIYDLLTFSHLIKRIINSTVHPETLKSWILTILKSYDRLLYEMSSNNMIFQFERDQSLFFITPNSVKKKQD